MKQKRKCLGGNVQGNVWSECPKGYTDHHAGLQVSTCSGYDLSPWLTHTHTQRHTYRQTAFHRLHY